MSTAVAGTEPTTVHIPGPENAEQAIAWVYSQVGYVQKVEGRNLGYSYASEAGLIAALRPAMVTAQLTARVISISDVEREVVPTSRGGTMNRTTLVAMVRFAHAPSETFVDVVALGEGMDVGDKSGNKAMTGALKYALRQTFLIETGDDPDHFSSGEQERALPEQQQTRGKGKQARPQTIYEWEKPLRDELQKAGMPGSALAPVFNWETPTKERINEYLSAEGNTVERLVSTAADMLAAREGIETP